MADDKNPVDSLLSSLEEIKKQTSEAPVRPKSPSPDAAEVKPKSGGDLLGSLLSEVKREADEEKARLDQTLASREEEKRRQEQEAEEEKRAKYQKLVQEESGRRQAQLRQKEEREKQIILDAERRIQEEADQIARAKAMVELEKKRKRQRVVNFVVAAVVIVAVGVALGVTRPWERTEPLEGIDRVETADYVAKTAQFKPMYDASDRGDPSIVEPRNDAGVQIETIPPIEAFGWLMQGEMRTVRPDRRVHNPRVLLADAASYRVHLEKRFAKMTWLESSYRPSSGSTSKEPKDDGLQLDLSAFGQKDKKKKKKR